MRPPFHLLRIVQGEQVDLGMVAWLIERKRHTSADTCSSPHSPTGCLGTSTSNQGELAGTASPNISRPAPTSLSLLHPHTAFFLDAGGTRVRVSTPQQGQSWQRSWTSNPVLCRFCCPAVPEPAVLAPQASVPSLGESSGGSLWPCLAWLQSVNLGLEDQAGLWCLNKGCPQD